MTEPVHPPGLFISLEGIDGAGKSTHLQALAQAMAARGREVVCTREPGGTPLAEALRSLVLGQAMDALTEALLVFAARRDHLREVIAPALARGAVVISDRYTDASFAYQGGGRGLAFETLQILEQLTQDRQAFSPDLTTKLGGGELLQPDLTLWLAIAPALAAQRLAGARLPDRFEREPLTFFQAVDAAYAQRARAHPQRIVRIDAQTRPEAVWAQVQEALRERGWLA